jgi:hypothetical protein
VGHAARPFLSWLSELLALPFSFVERQYHPEKFWSVSRDQKKKKKNKLRTSSNSFWSFLGFFNGFFFPPEKSSTG